MRIANDWLDSADYATLQGLARTDSERLLPSSKDSPLSDEPEEAIGARFATLADAGLLEVPDARLQAADHYIGLQPCAATINRLGTANAAADSRVQPLIVAGVRAFLRAYRVG